MPEWCPGGCLIPADLIDVIRDADAQRSLHYEPRDLVRKIYKAILDAADGAS